MHGQMPRLTLYERKKNKYRGSRRLFQEHRDIYFFAIVWRVEGFGERVVFDDKFHDVVVQFYFRQDTQEQRLIVDILLQWVSGVEP